jgi:hypothetical protein
MNFRGDIPRQRNFGGERQDHYYQQVQIKENPKLKRHIDSKKTCYVYDNTPARKALIKEGREEIKKEVPAKDIDGINKMCEELQALTEKFSKKLRAKSSVKDDQAKVRAALPSLSENSNYILTTQIDIIKRINSEEKAILDALSELRVLDQKHRDLSAQVSSVITDSKPKNLASNALAYTTTLDQVLSSFPDKTSWRGPDGRCICESEILRKILSSNSPDEFHHTPSDPITSVISKCEAHYTITEYKQYVLWRIFTYTDSQMDRFRYAIQEVFDPTFRDEN